MYTKRLVNKKIENFSTNELFEIINTSKDSENIYSAEKELKRRNLNETELISAKTAYKQYEKMIENRKNEPLTFSEWFSFFFIFIKTRKSYSPNDDFTDSELERFRTYDFETKFKQARQAHYLGILFFLIIIPIWIFLIIHWTK